MTSTKLYLGNHGNLLEDSRAACQLVRLPRPLLDKRQFEAICAIDRVGFKTARFRVVYKRDDAPGALARALDKLAQDVESAVSRWREYRGAFPTALPQARFPSRRFWPRRCA